MARAMNTVNTSPRPEDSRLIPGVEESDAEAGEVLDVSRHKRKAVFKGRGGDDGVDHLLLTVYCPDRAACARPIQ